MGGVNMAVVLDSSCTMCNGLKINNVNAYKSHSYFAINGRLPICKTCAGNIYDEYMKKYKATKTALYYTCRKLDVPFVTEFFDMAVKQRIKVLDEATNKDTDTNNVFSYYMARIFTSTASRFGNPKTFDDGEQNVGVLDLISEKDFVDEDDENTKDFYVAMKHKWGSGKLSKSDYIFLENEYAQMVASYGEPRDYSSKKFFEDIAHLGLTIKNKRENGEDYAKDIQQRNKSIEDAKIAPIDPNQVERTPPLGLIVKFIESNKPITLTDEKYADPDKLNELRVQIVGQLALMNGKDNKTTDEYKKYLNKYALDFESISKDFEDVSEPIDSEFNDLSEDEEG